MASSGDLMRGAPRQDQYALSLGAYICNLEIGLSRLGIFGWPSSNPVAAHVLGICGAGSSERGSDCRTMLKKSITAAFYSGLLFGVACSFVRNGETSYQISPRSSLLLA